MSSLTAFIRFLFSPQARLVLIPFVLVLLLLAVVFVAAEGTAWSPFLYAVH